MKTSTKSTMDTELASVVEASKRLVVVVHGLGKSLFIQDVFVAVREVFEDADVMTLKYDSSLWSHQTAPELAEFLARRIGDQWARRRDQGHPYEAITLVGHSIGVLLIRAAFLMAMGSQFTSQPYGGTKDWGTCVDRIVSLAGLNNGWAHPKVGLLHAPFLHLLRFAADALGKAEYLLSVAEGAPFIVDLRLHWLEKAPQITPKLIHLRGNAPDLITSTDTDGDLFLVPDVKGRIIERTAHLNVAVHNKETAEAIWMAYSRIPSLWNWIRHPIQSSQQYFNVFAFNWLLVDDRNTQDSVFQERKKELTDALGAGAHASHASFRPPIQDKSIKTVVMIRHGIRDFASGWPNQLATEIAKQTSSPVHADATGYQRFSMFQFLIPGARRAKVRLLMAEYTRHRVKYPEAEFCYFGHSYGTYLLAKALISHQSCKFNRIAFGGSVVCTDFDWNAVVDEDHAKKILNIRADSDLTVALFPGSFERLRIFLNQEQPRIWSDVLGFAGVHGFAKGAGTAVTNILIPGDHGASTETKRHQAIAEFLLGKDGSMTSESAALRRITKFAGNLSFLIVGFLIAGVIWGLISTSPMWAAVFLFVGVVLLHLV